MTQSHTSPPDESREKLRGTLGWVTSVDHEDIGLMYLVFGVIAGLLGGVDAMMLRTGLLTPTADVWGSNTYNALFTTHGLTMLFLFVTPVAFGLANFVVPSLIDTDDMAFPRLNATAFWLLPAAFILVRTGILADLLGIPRINPPATGWTLYPPLSRRAPNVDLDLVLLGLHLSGVSTLLSAVNFIVTIVIQARRRRRLAPPRHLLMDDPHYKRSRAVRVPSTRKCARHAPS